MDYADILRAERSRPHAIFHSVILELANYNELTTLLFFEGEDDPSFYFPHIRSINNSRDYLTFICYGRNEVIKTLDLIDGDGRVISKSLFFIDKDHSDFMHENKSHQNLFQTTHYSIENYLVCLEIINSYWVEILHLDSIDSRKSQFIDQFKLTYKCFEKRMLSLMALVLIGRGFTSRPARKLNLNNANLDLIFNVDFEKSVCSYIKGAGKHFALSTNVINYHETPKTLNRNTIQTIIKTSLSGLDSKQFMRGKYELWFLIKYLQFITKKLSCKLEAQSTGLKRATPKINITKETAIEHLGPRMRLPEDLENFLNKILIENKSPPRELELTSY